jgi:LAO/AO transport system kinase
MLQEIMSDYFELVHANGFFDRRRSEQSRQWMEATIREQLLDGFYRDPLITKKLHDIEKKVMEGRITSFQGATQLIGEYNRGKQR